MIEFCVTLFLLAGASQEEQPGKSSSPNFLFVVTDDHRFDMLGAAGNQQLHTPHLDRLARGATLLEQCIAHMPQCAPSRVTLLTGVTTHQHRHVANGVQPYDLGRSANNPVPTLPGQLAKAGYETLLIGKWHIFAAPADCGFTSVRTWLPVGMGRYQDPSLAQGPDLEFQSYQGFTTEVLTEDALDFLNSAAAREKPFFLWFATTAPHAPYRPNPEHIENLYKDRDLEVLRPPAFAGEMKPHWRNYYAAISHLDEQVGRLLQALGEQGLRERTVVVFLGDNGHMMGSRGKGGKVVPYEESIRVPCILSVPGFEGPRRSAAATSTLDLPATILRLANLTPPPQWPGRDLRPILRGEDDGSGWFAYAECASIEGPKWGDPAFRLIRSARHKLIVWRKAEPLLELYDLAQDPAEQRNLHDHKEAAGVRHDLLARLRRFASSTADEDALSWPSLQPAGSAQQDSPP
jgi:arylsulfatase A-like enzyme